MITLSDGGVAVWEVTPSADVYLVEVRLGDAFLNTRAASAVHRRGAALIDNNTLRFRFDAPMTDPLTIRAHERDIGRASPGDGVRIIDVHFWYKDGTRAVQSQAVNLDRSSSRAYATWLRVGEFGGYLRYYAASGNTRQLRVLWPSGATRTTPAETLPDGLAFFDAPEQRDPSGAYYLDDLGTSSRNILTRASGSSPTRARTPLIPWPLPPWLKPEADGVRPLLKAAETGLNLALDAVGGEISPKTASGRFLDLFAEYFGMVRKPRETDAELRVRLFNTVRRGKSSPGVMSAILSELMGVTVEVADADVDLSIAPGRMNVYFYGEPEGGFDEAAEVVRRYRAAGIVPTLLYKSLSKPATLARRLTLYGSQKLTHVQRTTLQRSPFKLDGSWRLDGTVSLGAGRFTRLSGRMIQDANFVEQTVFLQAEHSTTEFIKREVKAPPMFGLAAKR